MFIVYDGGFTFWEEMMDILANNCWFIFGTKNVINLNAEFSLHQKWLNEYSVSSLEVSFLEQQNISYKISTCVQHVDINDLQQELLERTRSR